jgi:hypothetical protein
MTNRERFHAVMDGNPAVDRCPVIEWATWWDKTLRAWETEGMPRDMNNLELCEYFGLDRNIQFWFPHYAPDYPRKAVHGAPFIHDKDDYLELKKYLLPKDAIERMEKRIEAAMPCGDSGDSIIWYTLEGFFWFPRELFGIEQHLYSFFDDADLYHRVCEDLLAWQLGATEKFNRLIKADFMTIAEDMSYNHGSMISEETFETFISPYYRILIPKIKERGTRVFIDSDGDVTKSVPWYMRAGAEGILPLEHQAGVDIGRLQENFPDFLFLGGFDKMCLLQDKAAIDNEILRILPFIRKGKYLPSVDHQTPPGVSMENYRYYIERLREASVQACKDAAT